MANLLRVSVIRLLIFAPLLFPLVARAQTRPPDVEQLAKAYGVDSWGQVDAVRYTFNLDIPALKLTLSRTWTW
jgi:hypothetical protein